MILGQGARGVIGVGRVKTPTLAIVCKRELEIRNFVPVTYFEVVATAKVASGEFKMRHAPQERILKRENAETVAKAAEGFEGPLGVRVEDKRQKPPKLHDLPSLQKLCSSRFGWSAAKTLEVAQELYDGQGKKIITYPRAEVRYLPESLIADVPKIVAGLQVGQSFRAIPVPVPPVIRRGASGTFPRQGTRGGQPSRRHPQRQHGRHAARGLAAAVDRREEAVRRDRTSLSRRPHARLPLPADDRDARRQGLPVQGDRSPAHRSRLARGIPGVAAGRREGRRRATASRDARRRDCPAARSDRRDQGDQARRPATTRAR